MRARIGLRINDGSGDQTVPRDAITGLRFKKTAPGGYHSASFQLRLPRTAFPNLGPANRLYLCGPTGRTLWEGFTDNPGRADGSEGQGFELGALGAAVIATDRSVPLIYRDRDLTAWTQYRASAATTSAEAGSSDDPTPPGGTDPEQGLLCQFNPGQPVGSGNYAQIGYTGIRDAGMEVGAIQIRVKSGKIDNGYRDELVYSSAPGVSGTNTLVGGGITTSQNSVTRYVTGVIPTGQTGLALQLRRSGAATNVTDDDAWSFFDQLAVLGRRMDRFGTLADNTAMTPADYVLAHQVVEDLLGRVLTGCDPVRSTIDTTSSFQIDQLAYTDGATAAQIFDDLNLYEPNYLWEILESTFGAGFRFNWRAWPTTPRYELSTLDGYVATGSDVDLCNRVAVYWTNARGVKKTTVVTATSADYPALEQLERAGRVKDAEPVTLPDGLGSTTAATRIGLQVLAEKADPPISATVTVRRPIRDNLTGGWAAPWELEPGYIARVRETGDLLRVTETEYVDDDGTCVLTLGTPVMSTDQRIARLEQRRRAA